jgi:hypothetical protein
MRLKTDMPENAPSGPKNRIRPTVTKTMLVAAMALTLAGCASSDRMMRVSPMSEPSESGSSVSKIGARDAHDTLREDRVNAFPLVYLNGAMHSVLWPFIDWDEQGLAIRPFYNREGENQSVLFPFTGWDSDGGWALNTIWDDNKGWLFLPVAGSWRDTTFIGPVHWSDDGSNGVFPLWNSEPKLFWLAELYASSWKNDVVSRRSMFGALYRQKEYANGDSSLWILPVGLFTHQRGDHEALTPLYSAGRERGESWLNIHPLWWSGDDNKGGSYSTLLPLWHHTKDNNSATLVTPIFSSTDDKTGSRFNIHPLWWSGSDATGASYSTLVPLWYRSNDKDGSALVSPLFSVIEDKEHSSFNIHPLWWDSSNTSGESTSALIPFWYRSQNRDGHALTTPLFSLGETNDEAWFNIHPLWWSSSNTAGESSSVMLPLWVKNNDKTGASLYTPLGGARYDAKGEAVAVNALGLAYHWSHSETHDYRHVLWPLYTSIDTHKNGGPGEALSLIWNKTGGGVEGFRVTPFFATDTGARAPLREWMHLVSFHETAHTSGFSITPLIAHSSGKTFSDTRVFPFYRNAVRDGETTRFKITPFYAQAQDTHWYDYLTNLYVVSDRPDDRDTRVALLFRNRVQKFKPPGEGMVSRDKKSGFSYTHETTVSRKLLPEKENDADIQTVREWMLYGYLHTAFITHRQSEPRMPGVPLTKSALEESRVEATKAVDEILFRHDLTKVVGAPFTDEARRVKCRRMLTAATRETTEHSFAIDPFFIPLFETHSGENRDDWNLLFGVAHSETKGERSKTSVLRYLYTRESGPDGSRLNCFPFVQYDDSKESTSFAFLWRVFNRKKDLNTGETKGHILFIPY